MAIPINAVKPCWRPSAARSPATRPPAKARTPTPHRFRQQAPHRRQRYQHEQLNYAVASGILPTGGTSAVEPAPRREAGLKEGDIIVDVDGTVITSTQQMVGILQARGGQTWP